VKATRLVFLTLLGPSKRFSRAEAIATKLRDMGLFPKGGRGLSAPPLSELDAAAFLLALAGADRVDDVPMLMNELRVMVDDQSRPVVPFIAELVASPEKAYAVRRILILAPMPMVEIEFRDGETVRFFKPELWQHPGFHPDAQGQGIVGQIGQIGGAILHQIAIEFSDKSEDIGAFDDE
jgi:hypothetical protein